MGKQGAPTRPRKLDKGPNNEDQSVKLWKGKRRYKLKKRMAKPQKVVAHREKKQKAVGFSVRTDIAGKRITLNNAKTSY